MTRLLKMLRARARARGRAHGFTLLELLVVLAILGLLAAIVGPQVLRFLSGAKSQTAQVQVRNVAAAMDLFQLDNGRYPTTEEGLRALVNQPPNAPSWNGPYLPRPEALNDPWGHAYLYRVPGKDGKPYDVYTLGADNAEGGSGENKDISN
jgi:general secretion pathway protein G